MVDLNFYSAIKMDEKDVLDFISLKGNGIGRQVFEFRGTNNQRIAMVRGGALHKWLVSAFNELAYFSKKANKVVYLVDVDEMIKKETRLYYDRVKNKTKKR